MRDLTPRSAREAQKLLAAQDEKLDLLHGGVRRVKELAGSMSNELKEQVESLSARDARSTALVVQPPQHARTYAQTSSASDAATLITVRTPRACDLR